MDCEVKLKCKHMNIGNCEATTDHCDYTYFHPEVQIEHYQQRARFTCTNKGDCGIISPTTCAPAITVVTSISCETTHTTTPSPVIGHISPTMCTLATITTTVVASTPHCETTTIVCNSSSTNLLATTINPLYTTSSIPIPTSSANMYTSSTGQNTIKNIISSHVAKSIHPTTLPSISRCVCSSDIGRADQSRSATTLHGVYMTVLLVLVAVTITMTTLVVYMCLMMRRAKSGRVPQTTTGTTYYNMAASDYCEPISLRYMQTTGTDNGR